MPRCTRLHCYLPAQPDEPDVVSDFQIDGWHLYLVENIESAQVTLTKFDPRPYVRNDDEISISISFKTSTAV